MILKIGAGELEPRGRAGGAVDLITNKRTISTNVMIEDGGIVVLGGLIPDSAIKGEQRVPFLGRIPIIGLAFKTRNCRRAQEQPDGLHPAEDPARRRAGRRSRPTRSTTTCSDQQKSLEQGRSCCRCCRTATKPKLPPPPPPPPPGTGEVDPRVLQEKLRRGQGDGGGPEQQQAHRQQVPPRRRSAPTNPPRAGSAARRPGVRRRRLRRARPEERHRE